MVQALRIVTALTTGLAFVLLTGGCKLFEPQTEFYGYAHNATQWRLICSAPSNPAERYALQPGDNFSDVLEGSRVYHFEADFPDGRVFSAFDVRVNSIDGDAGADGNKVGWYWEIGRSFQASRRASLDIFNEHGPRPRLVVLD